MLKKLALILILVMCTVTCTVAYADSTPTTKTITDMEGRSVTIPVPLQHVITVGSVPVINSFIIALGEGDTIMNDLPDSFYKLGRWKYQYVFAPNLKGQPSIQATNNVPNVEEVVKMNPEVVFAMDKPTVDLLEKSGVPVFFLSWKDNVDVKNLMTVLGEVYNKEDAAKTYIQYFDDTVKKVTDVSKTIPVNERKKVLYLQYQTMTSPLKITDWCISQAGGISVTNDTKESVPIGAEEINKWNPDIIIVYAPQQITDLLNDPKFADITAVKNKAVYSTPMGAHVWVNRGIETPLTVMWMAKTFYPDTFKDFDLEKEAIEFYKKFCGYECTPDQIKEILSGSAQI